MSVTAAAGFVADGVHCGIKSDGAFDLALVAAPEAVPAAAVFTRNGAAAPPVHVSKRHLADGRARAVVLSSGCANAGTGAAGMRAAQETAEAVAGHLRCDPSEVVVCSTGPIGSVVPVDRIAAGLAHLELSEGGGGAAARAILTTDTVAKESVRSTDQYTVGGMAKGAGMLRPDMATMLAVVTTDAALDAESLGAALASAVEVSFNALNVDGCESTNDTVVLLASGHSGFAPSIADFTASLTAVCRELSAAMAADAEGASKVVTIGVSGAGSDRDALVIARSIADSALVRSSFFGADPNWGRVLAALGASPVVFDPDDVEIGYAGSIVARGGVDIGADHDAISNQLKGDFDLTVSVGSGPGKCSLLTTDLTPDYVRFNGERS